jgi:hypothetical protein
VVEFLDFKFSTLDQQMHLHISHALRELVPHQLQTAHLAHEFTSVMFFNDQPWLDVDSVKQVPLLRRGLESIAWWMLVPDAKHEFLNAGFGEHGNADYATAALASDGSCAAVYLPTPRTVTLNLAKLKGPVTARGRPSSSPGGPAPWTGAAARSGTATRSSARSILTCCRTIRSPTT